MKQKKYTLFLSLLILNATNLIGEKGIVCVPIADLVGQPLAPLFPEKSAHDIYNNLAVGGEPPSLYTCPRIHQLLYNDIVDIVKTCNDEICIRTSHAFYYAPSSSTPQTTYWTLQKNILPLSDEIKNKINLTHVPEPIDFSDTAHNALASPLIATLIEPHYDKKMHITFSAGTRFLYLSTTKKKNSKKITLFVVDYNSMKEQRIKIPSYKCLISNQSKTKAQHITDYVNLLKQWAHTNHGSIPYVLGGTSFTSAINKPFKEITQQINGQNCSFYQYEPDINSPKGGFDCSGIIIRATQMCNIPYFCKNTTTIPQCLATIEPNERLTAGDLILFKGHVMIASDIAKNMLIEARGYSHGYGKIHEIALEHVFEGIHNYDELCTAYFNKKPLHRKDIRGTIRDKYDDFKLLKMISAWDKKILLH